MAEGSAIDAMEQITLRRRAWSQAVYDEAYRAAVREQRAATAQASAEADRLFHAPARLRAIAAEIEDRHFDQAEALRAIGDDLLVSQGYMEPGHSKPAGEDTPHA